MQTARKALPLALSIALGLGMVHGVAAQSKTGNPQAENLRESLTRGVAKPAAGGEAAPSSTGAVSVTLANPAYRVKKTASTPEATARDFLATQARQLGLDATALAGLELVSQRQDPDFTVVRLRQVAAGLPVYGSEIAVTIGKDGSVLYVASNAIGGVAPKASKTQAVDQQQALDRARSYLGIGELRNAEAQLVAFRDAAGTHTAWKVRGRPDGGPKGDWELLIDATSGEVLRAEDKAFYAVDGSGYVFRPDPLSSTKSSYGSTGYKDNNNADSTQLSAARVRVTLKDLKQSGASYSLSGPFASCVDFDAPRDNACPVQSSPAFEFTRGNLYFEAVNAYYHIDTFLRYVNQTLGIKALPYQYTGGVQFDPHGESGDDNSAYSSGSGQLTFGQGGVDDAEDADVVIHELGHGIHDWITNGGLSQSEGLSEGVGDYLAAGYSRDFNQWSPSDAQYNWVYNWDGHNEFWPGRVTNYNVGRTYAQIRSSEIHTAGQYWASCNLVARDAIGGQAMDKAFLKGLSMTNGSTNQKAAAQAVITAASALGYSSTQINAIANAYNKSCTYAVTVPQKS
ncbi:M36 family metallopeptidase [Burkholderia gladioli]|uniref:M36 family metallopeptidase n=1 Tax=Burkholderia gladioli TaxID=28095 RepID=UPI000CDAAFA8|nr:M36 family metallopeptidase [Burkholderia gladioli]NRF82495.1 PepSY domain-containing protein [Burkholderia gladioli]POS06090.1 peptidase [Burkholderia gladioli]